MQAGNFAPSSPAGGPQPRRGPLRTRQSRQLVELYWRSVVHAKTEPPLYHTYSDRYGGTRGVPFASRTASGNTLLREAAISRTDAGATASAAAATAAGAPADGEALFAWCMNASEAAVTAGRLPEARAHLSQALTQLQNSDGGLTVAALAASARGEAGSHAGQRRSANTGEVLRRLGKVALLCGDAKEALTFLDWSAEADPFSTEAYVLRAACHERLGKPAKAFDEYEKYMKLAPPSMEVLAHCGQCAAEAGNAAAAVRYLTRLLHDASATAVAAQSRGDSSMAASAAYYGAHASFHLGVVHQQLEEAEDGQTAIAAERVDSRPPPNMHAPTGESSAAVRRLFDAAAAVPAYVRAYEDSVDAAVETGDYAQALRQLRCLQRMEPDFADHFLRTAHVCHLRGDFGGEVAALSEALDRHQELAARRTTLLARGAVYAEHLGDLERAVKDFTLVVDLPAGGDDDRCTPMAYLKRAETLRKRQARDGCSASGTQDQEAALGDYRRFLAALDGLVEGDVCSTTCVTDALLTLASGAFEKRSYDEATHYFSRAMARGWQPQRPAAFCAGKTAAPVASGSGPSAGLYDEVYVALAHHVIAAHPAQADVFKVPYEPRDAAGSAGGPSSAGGSGLDAGPGGSGGRKAGGGGGGGGNSAAGGGSGNGGGGGSSSGATSGGSTGSARLADRKEVERTTMVLPSLAYLLVDARYSALRAMEPAVYSRLEEALLELWGPYRTEVERVREDAMALKGGRRTKRHT